MNAPRDRDPPLMGNSILETRLADALGQLERSNRETASFIQTLSHDLRAPIRAIKGYSSALEESTAEKLGAIERSYVAKMVTAAKQMERLIEDVMEYSRVTGDTITSERVDAQQVVRDVIDSNPHFQNKIEIVNSIPAVRAHEPTLKEVVSQLLANAIKFVPRGVEPRVRVSSETRGGEVRLWVDDNGIGVPAELHSKIFELFVRGHPGYDGSGVGLAIVLKASEGMHGKCGVESGPDKGSRFWVQLPLA